ncbi:hypothetical protein RND71_030832 [Anisodus tanguticus]|uniref:Uncharacterized protein n=1 Tax=Anisodus tanguticus TaxID=243964 RepID=A0AAE1V7Q4_9SOLA|nr:hypothetical protein RND71_030832 [Anisodus tanguticus]
MKIRCKEGNTRNQTQNSKKKKEDSWERTMLQGKDKTIDVFCGPSFEKRKDGIGLKAEEQGERVGSARLCWVSSPGRHPRPQHGTTVYYIWQERNLRVFQHKKRNEDAIVKLIIKPFHKSNLFRKIQANGAKQAKARPIWQSRDHQRRPRSPLADKLQNNIRSWISNNNSSGNPTEYGERQYIKDGKRENIINTFNAKQTHSHTSYEIKSLNLGLNRKADVFESLSKN